jgi:Cu(I)/Ag(I) efflux system membrane protein CusA/SilA
VEEAQDTLATAVGGENVSTVIAGRERYPINVRYLRDFRSDLQALGKVLVPVSGQQQIPLAELASVKTVTGPSMIRDENGMPTGYVYVDVAGRPAVDYVEDARHEMEKRLQLPAGYALVWSGQFESAERVRRRLWFVVPLTITIIIFLLYSNTRSWTKTMIVILAVPFSAVGALWLVYALGYSLSVAVWIGLIALLGVDAETGVFMLLYLDIAYTRAKRETPELTREQLSEAIVEGSARRLRPKFMTFATMCVGLIPVLWASGAGSEIMKRIAAPMVGGIVTSFLLELLVYPAVYALWKEKKQTTELKLNS